MAVWPRLAVGVAGLAIVALSPVPAWLLHVRNVGGHGLTAITVTWSAWEGRAWPFLPVAVAVAGLVAALALAALALAALPRDAPERRDRVGRLPVGPLLASGSLLTLALLFGSLVPLDRSGYASRVHLEPAWALFASSALALTMVAAALPSPGKRRMLAIGAAGLVALSAATYGGRVVALNLAEGDPRHYSDGTYLREATDTQPTEVLTIRDGAFTVGDRWSGSLSGTGLVVVLTNDPACPDARGAYRVFAAGGQDIRWNLIVDLCADGARGDDLTSGTWKRVP